MISQTAEYALRAMSCLALYPEELTPTTEVARQTHVPANYLAKVLQQLAGADLITGRRGVGGGYRLALPAAKINLLEVINAVSPVERIRECPLGLQNHGPTLCPLHKLQDRAAAAVIEIFQGVTLQDLIDDPKSSKPLCDQAMTTRLTTRGRS